MHAYSLLIVIHVHITYLCMACNLCTCKFVHCFCTGATPTLLKLKTMKGADGKPLKIIEKVSGGDYKTFGMYLLQDENGEQVKLAKKDHNNDSAKDITEEIIQKWLTSGAPTHTYHHLIECLKQSELGALAEQIAAIINH